MQDEVAVTNVSQNPNDGDMMKNNCISRLDNSQQISWELISQFSRIYFWNLPEMEKQQKYFIN